MILYEQKGADYYIERRQRFQCDVHLHHPMELVYISHGETEITVNDISYSLQEGDAAFVFPNQIHAFQDTPGVEGYILIVPPDDFPEFADQFSHHLPVSPVIRQAGKEVHRCFRYLCRHNASEDAKLRRAIQRGYLLALLGLLFSRLTLCTQSALKLSTVQRILLYCDTHYDEPLNLNTLSHHFGVNPCYISHLFSEKLHLSFNRYLHLLRIHAALPLLEQSELPVTEVADRVGYGNTRSFNRRFIEFRGCTPSEYRKAHRAEKTEDSAV